MYIYICIERERESDRKDGGRGYIRSSSLSSPGFSNSCEKGNILEMNKEMFSKYFREGKVPLNTTQEG